MEVSGIGWQAEGRQAVMGLILQAAGRIIDALPLWAIGALLCVAVGAYGGYHYAKSDKTKELEQSIDQAQDVASKDQETANHAASERTKIEIRYRTIIKRIPADPSPGCADLGPEFIGVFNDAIRAARGED